MVDFGYLFKGLCGLARAHRANALAGHLGAVGRAKHDPRTAEYWTTGTLKRDSALLTHRIKTLYGFFTLLRFVEDAAKRKEAEERFLYLMA